MKAVKVKHLGRGDVLSSGTTVLEIYDSCAIKNNQLNVRVRYANGNEKTQVWNKETVVSVINQI